VASGETILVATGLTNKLRAFRSDLSASGVTAAIFTKKVGTPSFSPPQGAVTNGTIISITTATPNATIYYTTNGSIPTTGSLLYSGPLTFHTNIQLMALGVESGYNNSSVASANFTLAQVATPVFNPSSGPITSGTVLSISCPTPGATVYYTTNGTTPTTNSIVYSGPIIIQGGTRVRAVGILENYADSAIKDVLFDLLKVATPIFDPPQGPTKTITITCATSNVVVRYTLDGSDPTTNSPVYSSPIVLNALTTVTARGFRGDLAPSDPLAVSYGLLTMESTVVTTLAGSTTAGFSNAVGMLAKFYYPVDVCLDAAGNIYVADSGNNVIRKITPSGAVTTFAGTGVAGTQNGSITNAQFSGINGICSDSKGNFYVQETPCGSWRVRKIDTNLTVTTFVSTGGNCGDFRTMEMGPDGNLYVGSQGSIQKVFPNGAYTLIAGPGDCSGGWCFSVGVAVDNLTNVYAATEERLWKIPLGQPPVTFAGSNLGTGGFSDGPRLQALFAGPLDAACVATGDIYVSDRTSIRRIRPDGVVTTMAGRNIPGYANGRGSDARFNLTVGICIDPGGNIYAVDNGNNCIRKISPDTAGIGIADDWQLAHFGHVGIDPNADPDQDGMSNFAEFWAGTDPLDANSALRIDNVLLISGGQAQIRWQTVAGKTYVIQYSSNLTSWTSLGSPVLGDGSIAALIDPASITNIGQRFYRLVLTGF
jgi:hypothetical protein